MNDTKEKLIDFKTYCPLCKHSELDETKDPCNLCLAIPAQPDSHKPVYFKEQK